MPYPDDLEITCKFKAPGYRTKTTVLEKSKVLAYGHWIKVTPILMISRCCFFFFFCVEES